jgi:hypothetical protein
MAILCNRLREPVDFQDEGLAFLRVNPLYPGVRRGNKLILPNRSPPWEEFIRLICKAAFPTQR